MKSDDSTLDKNVVGAAECKRRRPGPKPLSPNGVDQELAHEGRRVARRRKKGARGRTVSSKRMSDLLARAKVQMRRNQRGQGEAGKTARERRRCVLNYEKLRSKHSEADAADCTAKRFHVSPSTVRHYARLYRQGGLALLLPKPKGPGTVKRRVEASTERLIILLRVLFGWNEKRMARELVQRGLAKISHTTLGHIFHRHYLPVRTYHSKAKSEGLAYRRYAKAQPNQQWHMDFAQITLRTGCKVNIAVLVDDASRFCLACSVMADLEGETALHLIRLTCQRLGVVPQEIVTDNGATFVSVYENVPALFTTRLVAQHIHHRRTAIYYPEGNGKAEAFVKIVKNECFRTPLAGAGFADPDEVQQALDAFVTYYNFYRLHSALDYQPPALRYWNTPAPVNHGLFGLPGLPADIAAEFPPSPTFQPVITDPAIRRRALALVSLTC